MFTFTHLYTQLFNRLKKEAGEDESGVGGDERIKQWAGRMSYVRVCLLCVYDTCVYLCACASKMCGGRRANTTVGRQNVICMFVFVMCV